MSHTNHRRGTPKNLADDFVVLAMASRGINDTNATEKLQQFLHIAARHNPVNSGNMKSGNMHTLGGIEKLAAGMQGGIVHAVFNREDALVAFLGDLQRTDLGLSVVLTGLLDKAGECCKRADLHRHTVEYSLGIFGKAALQPDPDILELTTMCGHGQVSFNLVRRMVKDVARGVLTLDEATAALTKPCVCGIFDPTRAHRLLERLVAESIQPALRNYIVIDPSKCDKCYACEVACAESHPVNNGQAMCIVDASLGPAISLHCLHCAGAPCMKACSTGNIVRDAASDAIYMRGDRCIGCKLCVSACPFGMIVWDAARGVASKCDLCRDRLRDAKAPACVEGCPTGSLSMAATAGLFKKRRLLALQTTLAASLSTVESDDWADENGDLTPDARAVAPGRRHGATVLSR